MNNNAINMISVIMPCYNAAPFIEEAISSVLQQTYPDAQIIVIDDGSDDATPDIIRNLAATHPDRITLLHQDHQGPYPARNLGLRHARGNYIAFLDADDWWREDCLERLLRALQDSSADLAYCGWQNVGEYTSNSEPYIPPAYEEQDTVSAFLRSCPWPIHAALVRRTVLDAVQGFSERCFSSMDYDLWLRILAHTRNIVRVPEVLAFYRWHGSGQISATKWKQVLDAVQVRRDFTSNASSLVKHIPPEALQQLVDGQLLKEAYRAYWKRDLPNAQKLFREAFKRGGWQRKDLRYILPALIPLRVFQRLVAVADKTPGRTAS